MGLGTATTCPPSRVTATLCFPEPSEGPGRLSTVSAGPQEAFCSLEKAFKVTSGFYQKPEVMCKKAFLRLQEASGGSAELVDTARGSRQVRRLQQYQVAVRGLEI